MGGFLYWTQTEACELVAGELKRFFETLGPFDDCLGYRDEQSQKRYGDTCQWIFDNEVYNNWVDKTSPILLWISGDPGSGKTVLTAYLSKEIAERLHKARRTHLLTYFFCDDTDSQLKTATGILKSLIYQILRQAPKLLQQVPVEYREVSNKNWVFGSLWQVFESIIKNNDAEEICCLIDALDECEEESRERFLEKLKVLFGDCQYKPVVHKNFKMIITSRPHIPVISELKSLTEISLRDNNTEDIQKYVRHKVDEIAKKKGLPEDLKQHARQALEGGASGMFLWVSLILDELENFKGTSNDAILQKLNTLPKDIPAVYTKILRQTGSSDDREKAKRILQWVIYAERPLKVEELKIVIALHPKHKSISTMQGQIENNLKEFLRLLFGPLLRIQQDKVYLVHQSVKDFLIEKIDPSEHSLDSEQHSLFPFRILPDEAHLRLAIDCLNYLSLDNFGPSTPPHYNWIFQNTLARREITNLQRNHPHESGGTVNLDLSDTPDHVQILSKALVHEELLDEPEKYLPTPSSSTFQSVDHPTPDGFENRPYIPHHDHLIRSHHDLIRSFVLAREGVRNRLKKYHFLRYAATHWPEHVRRTNQKDDAELWNSFLKLAQSNAKINSAYEIYHSCDLRSILPPIPYISTSLQKHTTTTDCGLSQSLSLRGKDASEWGQYRHQRWCLGQYISGWDIVR